MVNTRTALIVTDQGHMYASTTNGFDSGANWFLVDPDTSGGPWVVTYGGDRFIAASRSDPRRMYYSFDGALWTSLPFSTLLQNFIAQNLGNALRIHYKGGLWFVRCAGGFLVSSDGLNWGGGGTSWGSLVGFTYRPEAQMYSVMTNDGGVYYYYGNNPGNLGVWKYFRTAITGTVTSFDYGNTQYGVVTNAGEIWWSNDGLNYSKNATASLASTNTNRIRYHGDNSVSATRSEWIVVNETNTLIYTAIVPSSTWTSRTTGITGGILGLSEAVYDGVRYAELGFSSDTTGRMAGGSALNANHTAATLNGLSGTNNRFLYGAGASPWSAPSAVVPAGGAVVTTPGPILSATVAPMSGVDNQRVQWQIDTANTFATTNLRTLSSNSQGNDSVHTLQVPPEAALSTNGTYYVRARAVSLATPGATGPWSATQTFTVSLAAIPVPTSVNATNLTDYWPTLNATIQAAGVPSKLEFQIATSNAFTTIISTSTQPDSFYANSGASSLAFGAGFDPNTFIFNGTYYLRARQVTAYGLASAWSAGSAFTVTPSAPTLSAAAKTSPSSVTGNSYPEVFYTLVLNDNMANYPREMSVQVQTATDAGFTTSTAINTSDKKVPAHYGKDAGLEGVKPFTGSVKILSRLPQQTIYVRFRLVDATGTTSAWSSSDTFLVKHEPTAVPTSPLNGTLVNYDSNGNTFEWRFTDSSDNELGTAYQIIVSRVSDGVVVMDTGQVALNQNLGDVDARAVIPAIYKGVQVSWKIRVWDQDGVVGPYSQPRTVTYIDAPTLTIVTPGSSVTTGRPTTTWTVGGTAPQAKYSLKIVDTLTGVAVFSVSGTSAQSITPSQNILDNGKNYLLTLNITTTLGSTATASLAFSVAYTPPPTPVYSVSTATYEDWGYIEVDWSSTIADQYFQSWTVWRRTVGQQSTWTAIKQYLDPNITNHHDWTAITGVNYEYIVSQDAYRSNTILGSSLSTPNPPVVATSGGWFFIDPLDEKNNIRLNVTADSFTDEWEESSYVVAGRGRRKEVGTYLGVTGTVTASIRDGVDMTAKQRFAAIRALRRQNKLLIVRDPFGNLYNMTIGNIQYQHVAGTGSNEMFDVTIQLDEVFE